MEFEDFIKEKKVFAIHPDSQKAKALVKMAKGNLDFITTLPLTEQSASIIQSQSYESLRQIVEAIAFTKGFKIYSHEAYTFYLVKLGEQSISEHFDRLRKLRNGIHYYGKAVSENVAKKSLERVTELIKILEDKYL